MNDLLFNRQTTWETLPEGIENPELVEYIKSMQNTITETNRKMFDTMSSIVDTSTGATTFVGLTDTPGAFTTAANQMVVVNAGSTGVGFTDTLNNIVTFATDAIVGGNFTVTGTSTFGNDIVVDSLSTLTGVVTMGTDATVGGALTMGSNINFGTNQAVDMVLHTTTEDPASPATGQIWFRSDV